MRSSRSAHSSASGKKSGVVVIDCRTVGRQDPVQYDRSEDDVLTGPDPTFYPSPPMAMQSPPEELAYVALINPRRSGTHDAIGVVDLNPDLYTPRDEQCYPVGIRG